MADPELQPTAAAKPIAETSFNWYVCMVLSQVVSCADDNHLPVETNPDLGRCLKLLMARVGHDTADAVGRCSTPRGDKNIKATRGTVAMAASSVSVG